MGEGITLGSCYSPAPTDEEVALRSWQRFFPRSQGFRLQVLELQTYETRCDQKHWSMDTHATSKYPLISGNDTQDDELQWITCGHAVQVVEVHHILQIILPYLVWTVKCRPIPKVRKVWRDRNLTALWLGDIVFPGEKLHFIPAGVHTMPYRKRIVNRFCIGFAKGDHLLSRAKSFNMLLQIVWIRM